MPSRSSIFASMGAETEGGTYMVVTEVTAARWNEPIWTRSIEAGKPGKVAAS
jgi:hypothetical protein